jgi:putative phosphoesterase
VRVAALYDVHGMLVPLEAVLAEVEAEGVDAIVLGGDLTAGPQPRETLARLRALAGEVHWVRGNHERLLVEGGDDWAIGVWAAPLLSEDDRRSLAALPERVELDLPLGCVLFCHGTPRSDEEIVTPLTTDERLATIVAGVDVDVVVAGHTHIQDDRRIGALRWVNAGSVGMPYEGEVAAFWALLGDDVELRRTPFDVEACIAAVEASGMPQAAELVAENLRDNPSRAGAAAHFEALAGG